MCGGPTATLVVPILALSGATSHWTVIAAVLPGRRSMQGARGAGSFGGSRQFDPSHTVGIGCVAKTGIGLLACGELLAGPRSGAAGRPDGHGEMQQPGHAAVFFTVHEVFLTVHRVLPYHRTGRREPRSA